MTIRTHRLAGLACALALCGCGPEAANREALQAAEQVLQQLENGQPRQAAASLAAAAQNGPAQLTADIAQLIRSQQALADKLLSQAEQQLELGDFSQADRAVEQAMALSAESAQHAAAQRVVKLREQRQAARSDYGVCVTTRDAACAERVARALEALDPAGGLPLQIRIEQMKDRFNGRLEAADDSTVAALPLIPNPGL